MKRNKIKNWDDLGPVVTVNTAKDVLAVKSTASIYRLIKSGQLKAFKVGKMYRIKRDELMRFMEGGENA